MKTVIDKETLDAMKLEIQLRASTAPDKIQIAKLAEARRSKGLILPKIPEAYYQITEGG